MPTIPPKFDNGEIVTDYQCKAEIFNNYFASHCTLLDNFDLVPEVPQRTRLDPSSIEISAEKILSIIKVLDQINLGDGIKFPLGHCPKCYTPRCFSR